MSCYTQFKMAFVNKKDKTQNSESQVVEHQEYPATPDKRKGEEHCMGVEGETRTR